MDSSNAASSLLVLLEEAQLEHGCVPRRYMAELAQSFGIPLSEVYGVASFYSFITTAPLGRNVIRVCKSLPCYLKHSTMIVEAIAETLGISPGQTTQDGSFSLELVNCIGACDAAPAMLINGDVHGSLTPDRIAAILQQYK